MTAKKQANGLTIKQNEFVKQYMKCGNASEAYRRSYNTENSKDKTIGNEATKMINNPVIAMEIERRTTKANERYEVTRGYLIDNYKKAIEIALEKEEATALRGACDSLAEFCGLKKKEDTGSMINIDARRQVIFDDTISRYVNGVAELENLSGIEVEGDKNLN